MNPQYTLFYICGADFSFIHCISWFWLFSFALHMIDGEEVMESHASELTEDPECIGNLEVVESSILVIWHLF